MLLLFFWAFTLLLGLLMRGDDVTPTLGGES